MAISYIVNVPARSDFGSIRSLSYNAATMTGSQLEDLKADYLEWTGGFPPESVEDVEAYIATSMPFDIDPTEATKSLIGWLRESSSLEVGRYVNEH